MERNIYKIGKELFITSDEEIKKDDYYLGDDNHIYNLCTTVNSNGKKIILTTNADYIEEGIQAIDDEFLEWFIKNPSCEEVEVKLENYYASGALQSNLWQYKVIIPKDEPKQTKWNKLNKELDDALEEEFGSEEPKQEPERGITITHFQQYPIEVIAANLADPNICKTDNWIAGAKYQAERMYSEEEVVKLWNWLNDGFIIRKSLPTREELIGWFEQFKNKKL